MTAFGGGSGSRDTRGPKPQRPRDVSRAFGSGRGGGSRPPGRAAPPLPSSYEHLVQGRRFELRKAYCSGNDRDVPVLLIGDLAGVETPSPRDAQQLVCLDYGVRCTGYMCPLFSVPTGGEPARPAPARTPSAERGRTS